MHCIQEAKMTIRYFNRLTGNVEEEKVYGDQFINWLYGTKLGEVFHDVVSRPLISKLYGAYQDLGSSASKVAPFVEKFNINLDDFLPEEGYRGTLGPYSNFNQFFVRRFKEGKRSFVQNPNEMAAFSEARYYGYAQVDEDETVPVKGTFLSPSAILGHSKYLLDFQDGPLLLARLCPVDYHRFHFPDDGVVIDNYPVPGELHSVNPLALKAKGDILMRNYRHVTIVETKNFGKLAYIEVGATCVGKIIQTHNLSVGSTFKRGEEKGMFLFGGSTVIVIGQKGKWLPSEDILKNTKNGMETYLQLGMSVATKK